MSQKNRRCRRALALIIHRAFQHTTKGGRAVNRHEQDTTSSRYAVFAAKVQAPRLRCDLVIRSRLYTQLQPLLQARLGLVSAPAGFGKTTLISAAIQHFGWQAAWVSLDASDNNPLRFWICLF